MALGIPTTGGPGSPASNPTGSIAGIRPEGAVEVPEGTILTKLNDAVNWGFSNMRKTSQQAISPRVRDAKHGVCITWPFKRTAAARM